MNISDYLMSQRDVSCAEVRNDHSFPKAARIICTDGFSLSVQANPGAYCSPRTNIGPWTEVEVGFPSETPTQIMDYCEDPNNPTTTVYGYVPVELVEELIESHGGMQEV